MLSGIAPFAATLALVLFATLVGVFPIKKLIHMHEAKHELKQGSPGFLRSMSGWIIVAIWIVATWFFATIAGDWWMSGDFAGAVERSGGRLELILRLLAAVADD